jgi:hypothetical protein
MHRQRNLSAQLYGSNRNERIAVSGRLNPSHTTLVPLGMLFSPWHIDVLPNDPSLDPGSSGEFVKHHFGPKKATKLSALRVLVQPERTEPSADRLKEGGETASRSKNMERHLLHIV